MQEYIEFAQAHALLLLSFVIVLGLIIWSEYSRLTRQYKQVNVNQAVQILNRDNVTVIDVRSNSEIRNGVIKGAKTIPFADISKHLVSLEKNKNNPFLVYCASGSRSGHVCNILTKNGFNEVYNLTGGIMAWTSENLPLNRK